MSFKTMDDIIAEFRGDSPFDGLLKKPIKEIQRIMRESDKKTKITKEELQDIIKAENNRSRPRKSLKRWIRECIERGEIIGEYYLDYMATVGIYKSAMQKYIRRGMPGKAVKAAKALEDMQKASLIRRLRVIIPEDVYTCMNIYPEIESRPIDVAYTLAKANKDGHCCRAFNEIKNLKRYESGEYKYDWFSDNWDTAPLAEVVSALFQFIREPDGMEKVEYIWKDRLDEKAPAKIMEELRSNSKVDYDLTLVALLRMLRTGYDRTVKVDKYKEEAVPLKINEVEWFIYDMHTFPGRIIIQMTAKEARMKTGDVSWSWWFGEASLRKDENKPISEYEKYIGEKEKHYRNKWKKLKPIILDKAEYVCKELFKLDFPEIS